MGYDGFVQESTSIGNFFLDANVDNAGPLKLYIPSNVTLFKPRPCWQHFSSWVAHVETVRPFQALGQMQGEGTGTHTPFKEEVRLYEKEVQLDEEEVQLYEEEV